MADERSVDVDEPRDPESGDGSSPRRPVAAAVQLPPSQEAWGRYATHTLTCSACRDVDQSCDESGQLYRAWREQTDQAYRRLGGETA